LSEKANNTDDLKPTPNSGKRVLIRASITLSLLTILSRILGLFRDSLVAVIFGAGGLTDAFFVALRIPNAFRRMVAEGSLATASVPLLSKARDRSKEEFSKTLTTLIILSLAFTIPITAVGIVYSREFILLLSPGLGTEENLVFSATKLLEILMPFLVFISITAVLASGLNSLHRYAISALPPIILNLAMLSGLGVIYLSEHKEISLLAWSFLCGSIISVIPLLLELRLFGYGLRRGLPETKRSLEKFFLLFIPSLFSSSANQILMLVSSLLASMLPLGTISCLYYADRLYQLPLGVFSIAIATAALPRLSELRDKPIEFSNELTQILGWAILIVIPSQIGLYTLASPIVRLIYEHGNFTSEGAQTTALALQGYTFGLLPVTLQAILVRAYLAKGYGRIPAISTVVATIITPLVALALMGTVTSPAANALALVINTLQIRLRLFNLGAAGLALSGGIGITFAAAILLLLLKKIKIELNHRQILITIIQSLIAGGAMYLVISFLRFEITNLTALVVTGVPVAALVYGASLIGVQRFLVKGGAARVEG
jgi:putative peptidoglycan lipid II flippase